MSHAHRLFLASSRLHRVLRVLNTSMYDTVGEFRGSLVGCCCCLKCCICCFFCCVWRIVRLSFPLFSKASGFCLYWGHGATLWHMIRRDADSDGSILRRIWLQKLLVADVNWWVVTSHAFPPTAACQSAPLVGLLQLPRHSLTEMSTCVTRLDITRWKYTRPRGLTALNPGRKNDV